MHNLNSEQKLLHKRMLLLLVERGVKLGWATQQGTLVMRIEPSIDGAFWPEKFNTYYPPFRYSLDALQVVEKSLTKGELKDYADALRQAVTSESTGIMMTHALAQIASSEARFDCLCYVLNLFDSEDDIGRVAKLFKEE